MRLLISGFSIGTNDALTWEGFAREIIGKGLIHAYQADPQLNHPPLMAEWSVLAMRLANVSGISFYFIFRLLPIAADVGSCLLLRRIFAARHGDREGWRAAAAYAWAFNAMLISGYHCNTDSVYAFFGLLAIYFIEERRQYFCSGLAMAATINVKLIPILLLLPLFLLCRSRRERCVFAGGVSAGLLPFIFLLTAASRGFFSHVVGYSPKSDIWGITLLLEIVETVLSPIGAENAARLLRIEYAAYGRLLLLAAVFTFNIVAVRRGIRSGYALCAMTMALFLILTPSFALQYTVAVLPMMFAVDVTAAMTYSVLCGAGIFIFYLSGMNGAFPPFYSYLDGKAHPVPRLFVSSGLLAWGVLIYFVARYFPKAGKIYGQPL